MEQRLSFLIILLVYKYYNKKLSKNKMEKLWGELKRNFEKEKFLLYNDSNTANK